MSTAGLALVAYFSGGLIALALFDIITHRIRDKFSAKVAESQGIFNQYTSTLLGRRAMTATLAVIMWLFWPAVLLGAVTDRGGADQAPKIQSRVTVIGLGPRAQMSYWVKKIWYGECPDCRVILTPLDIWGQYAACPVCKAEFKGIRLKASKEENHGETGQREDSEDTSGGGGINSSPDSEEDSKQPTRTSHSEKSQP